VLHELNLRHKNANKATVLLQLRRATVILLVVTP